MIGIIGSSGTVGTALRAELGRHDIPFIGFYRSLAKAGAAGRQGEVTRLFDGERPVAAAQALDGISSLFLLGAGARGQIEAERSTIQAAKDAGVRKIVKLSVIKADDPGFSIGAIHLEIERDLQASGVDFVILRPNGFMQNFVNYMANYVARGTIYLPAGEARIAHVDIRDIAAVARVTLTGSDCDGKTLTLTGPSPLSYHDAAQMLSRVLGWPVRYQPVPDGAARESITATGMPDWYADHMVNLNRFYRRGQGEIVTSTVLDVTGRPARTFEEFVRSHEPHFKAGREAIGLGG